MATKTFIGPKLRQLRRARQETQGQMAKALGISPTYVNLLENNQRSVSVPVFLRLLETYGVKWQEIAKDEDGNLLSDLRSTLADPMFAEDVPDLQELRAALVHCPSLARAFLKLRDAHGAAMERLMTAGNSDGLNPGDTQDGLRTMAPEAVLHGFFRQNRNYFDSLESAAERFWGLHPPTPDDQYQVLKQRLKTERGIGVKLAPAAELPNVLREYNEAQKIVYLSEGLNHPNRVFQLIHILALQEYDGLITKELSKAGIRNSREMARCRVELANYFAAAALMPYDAYLTAARQEKYDFDRLAAKFGVSFEQVCHRATTLQKEGSLGVPFFFLRIDKAGNVTKRFNATPFQIAEFGGACPRWDIHTSFRTPGKIIPQFVELPDSSQYFTITRTVDRPALGRFSQDNRLAITLGCSVEHVEKICYASPFRLKDPGLMTPIGITCRVCPRQHCNQRAQQPLISFRPLDENIRGTTRFET